MEEYKFDFNGKTYELNEDNCGYFENHPEKPVSGLELPDVIVLLKQQDQPNFNVEYFDQTCPNCLAGKAEKAKVFPFLENHFFIFTNKGEYVTSSLSEGYSVSAVNMLQQKGKVDNSYIVSVIVCANCGEYSVEIDQCEV